MFAFLCVTVKSMKLHVLEEAPDFFAYDQNGMSHSLKDYSGQYLLLFFYPKDNTPGCITEVCAFRDEYDSLSPYVNILGVNSDSKESHKDFAQKYTLPFPLLTDSDKRIIEQYGVNGVFFSNRTSFLIDPEGKIVKIYDHVDPSKHAHEILEDVKDLIASR